VAAICVLFKFRCNILIGVRIIKETPGSVASGIHCISHQMLLHVVYRLSFSSFDKSFNRIYPMRIIGEGLYLTTYVCVLWRCHGFSTETQLARLKQVETLCNISEKDEI